MFNIVLYEPEIPPNTGNIIRLCVNTSANLHLIKPLGFNLDEKQVRRAGLDYHDTAKINIYETYNDCLNKLKGNRFFGVTTKATKYYGNFEYKKGDVFVNTEFNHLVMCGYWCCNKYNIDIIVIY